MDPDELGLSGDARETADRPTVGGVVLAAGTSSRFGDENKLLAQINEKPLVRHAVGTLVDSGLDPVVVVTGYEAAAVGAAVDAGPVSVVTTPEYTEGQSASVRAGANAMADAQVDAAVFLPGDMPFVDPSTVRALVDAYVAGAGDALASAYRGRRGNPVLFDRRHFDALRALEGDVGGREVLIGSDDAALVAVADRGVRIDIDTKATLRDHR
ncbi:nucleotidyltransferase family protein (plasmid) [Halobaculum magnesiiphilum]|uniref:Nucleotidyltransferase family protein n=1 Tax=Halobaculum magnesiiphilum TaxID=1017351 RepID=A0A8T8WIV7_9EURY|nr:nucleotidyltransferase family protein [Halobaculum magnesiiphilum]